MKKISIIIVVFLGMSLNLLGEPGPPHSRDHKVLQEYRNLRLLQTLNLSEKQSEKILPLLNKIEQHKNNSFVEQQNLTDQIEQKLSKGASRQDIKRLNQKYLNLMTSQMKQMKKDLQKLQKALTPEQFSRFLLFERRFGRRLKERLEKMQRMNKK